MNRKFTIYTKEGEVFTLEFYRFEYTGEGFTLFNDSDQPSKDGFLSADTVAAVIPQTQTEPRDGAVVFNVYLNKHKEAVRVVADSFERDGAVFKFYWRRYPGGDARVEVENVYVAASEVVAISDEKGLRKFRY
jgi:hypothetical protein